MACSRVNCTFFYHHRNLHALASKVHTTVVLERLMSGSVKCHDTKAFTKTSLIVFAVLLSEIETREKPTDGHT
jgi:hypothetical protein